MSIEKVEKNGANGHAMAAHDELGGFGAVSVQSGLEPSSMKQMWWLCQQLVGTGFLPDAIKQPGQALAIIMAGRELGLEPMQSLRGIDIIKGKIRLSASTQLSLMLKAGVRIEWVQMDEKAAVLTVSRDGHKPATFKFSMEDAKIAGLIKKNSDGSPGMYDKHPAAMLRARVISAAGRAYCPDVLDGVYDPEEIGPQPAPMPTASVEVHEISAKQTRTASVKEKLANKAENTDAPPAPTDSEAA